MNPDWDTLNDARHRELDQQVNDLFGAYDGRPEIAIDSAAVLLSTIVGGASQPYRTAGPSRLLREDLKQPRACALLLDANSWLVTKLAEAHQKGAYKQIRMLPILDDISFPVAETSQSTSEALDKWLIEIRPLIVNMIREKRTFPTWSGGPSTTVSSRAHLRQLAIPLARGQPRLFLHELGQWSEGDAQMTEIIENIFGAHHSIFQNASGTGKTRLVLEGLHHHWGFYVLPSEGFEGEGSEDLYQILGLQVGGTLDWSPVLPSPSHPRYQSLLERNKSIAVHAFYRILVARLVIFKEFLLTAIAEDGGLQSSHKALWTRCQIYPRDFFKRRDLFMELSNWRLENVSTTTLDDLSSALQDILSTFRTNGHPETLYFVLDEAQTALESHDDAFEDNALLEMARFWCSIPQPIHYIFVGTSPVIAAICAISPSSFRILHTTGGFEEPTQQRMYMEKYIPTSEMTQEFTDKVWVWLRGRHRLTASLIGLLLAHGVKGFEYILNKYVASLSGISLNSSWRGDYSLELPISRVSFSSVHPEMTSVVNWAVSRFLTLAEPTVLKVEQSSLTDELARYVGREPSPRVDEPIMLLGAAHDTFTQTEHSSREYLALHLFNGWGRAGISEIFCFNGSAPPWADGRAQPVALSMKNGVLTSHEGNASRLAVMLHFSETSLFDKTFFVFPDHHSAPSITFLLKTNDEKYFWVAVRVQPLQLPNKKKTKGPKGKASRQFDPFAWGSPMVTKGLKGLYAFLPGEPAITGHPYSLLCALVTETGKAIPKTRPLKAKEGYPIVRLDRAAVREPITFGGLRTWATRAAELSSQQWKRSNEAE